MKRIKKKIFLAASLALLGLVAAAAGRALAQGRLSQLMADKVKYSQQLLEGIALADFKKVADSAERLIRISKTAEWGAIPGPRYEMHSNEFQRAAEAIVQKARAKNLDGAALAYLELTMSCVRCHQYVREVRDARLPALPPGGAGLVFGPGR